MTSSDAGSGRDIEDILRLLLNARQLTQYYHFEQRPERVPLKIFNRTNVQIGKLELTAAGKPVQLVSNPNDRAIEITRMDVGSDHAEIAFTFRIEGVVGAASFKKVQNNWSMDKLRVGER